MSTPKKGMYIDQQGIHRYLEPGTGHTVQAKSWWFAEVTRKSVDSSGETKRKHAEACSIYALREEVAGFAIKQCPDPWPGVEGDVKTTVHFRPLRSGDRV